VVTVEIRCERRAGDQAGNEERGVAAESAGHIREHVGKGEHQQQRLEGDLGGKGGQVRRSTRRSLATMARKPTLVSCRGTRLEAGEDANS